LCYLNYNKDGFLTWKKSTGAAKGGTIAGSKTRYGYIDIRINKQMYRAHRIIWEIHNGDIPDGFQIDHINGVRDDNRIENLRVVTIQENRKNHRPRSDNKSGKVGVYWVKSRNKWGAEIQDNKKKVLLGQFTNKTDAIKAREEAEKKYGYHVNHGKFV